LCLAGGGGFCLLLGLHQQLVVLRLQFGQNVLGGGGDLLCLLGIGALAEDVLYGIDDLFNSAAKGCLEFVRQDGIHCLHFGNKVFHQLGIGKTVFASAGNDLLLCNGFTGCFVLAIESLRVGFLNPLYLFRDQVSAGLFSVSGKGAEHNIGQLLKFGRVLHGKYVHQFMGKGREHGGLKNAVDLVYTGVDVNV